ncbi:YlaH-like family protein [Chengkuizengella marina]|uniref:YlaH-like protein n=1 Tax=Chengkuizengella marina TaxID=2507566 RepID=A0A6N9Q3M0_9BACL|nr:YlaH-like family protein [Chengkuizengella marina]NBI29396.1 hypothetical protein [Chengkuizengella marina]
MFLLTAEPVDIQPIDWGAFVQDHWYKYIIIFICLIYVFNKVFRVKKLPILKDLVIYSIIALFSFILLIFEIDVGLPIILSLMIAVALMFIVRIRYFFEDRKNRN